MDGTLDEDFVNFESVSQTCSGTSLASATDEDLNLLDREVNQRELTIQGLKDDEKNNNDVGGDDTCQEKPKSSLRGGVGDVNCGRLRGSSDRMFTTFSYNSTNKRLTMIPIRYKMKEERRKVLKISVNKLKKIEDPESWLCRSVLINNTMKKLQKETRDEKINKQSSVIGLSHTANGFSESDNFKYEPSNVLAGDEDDDDDRTGDRFGDREMDGLCFGTDEAGSGSGSGSAYPGVIEAFPRGDAFAESSLSSGSCPGDLRPEDVPLSARRCAARKRSLDEDVRTSGCGDGGHGPRPGAVTPAVDDCDVGDVLSQLYVPPTPRTVTSVEDDDADEDGLNVVDLDSTYIETLKSECEKLPKIMSFDESDSEDSGKRVSDDDDEHGPCGKRRRLDTEGFECGVGEKDSVCGSDAVSGERTSGESVDESTGGSVEEKPEEEQIIELEDEEDIKRRLSQSLSSHYNRKCDNFYEDCCDNQYSCGHTVTMFSDIQSVVSFHNLIASLET